MTWLEVVALMFVYTLAIAAGVVLGLRGITIGRLRRWYAVPRDGAGPRVGPFWTRTGAAMWCAKRPGMDYTARRRHG
jgi:hypothetical protein